jgi:hypothetical protein
VLLACKDLNTNYQKQYQLTKRNIENGNGKQLDLNEMAIFGQFDLFCRRVTKKLKIY